MGQRMGGSLQNLDHQETKLLLRVIDRLSRTLDTDQLRRDASQDLLRLLKADFAASYIWNDHRRIFENAVYLNMSPDNLARYEAYYQFHDPITSALQKRRRATLVSQVMPQEELEKTEFFNDFLMRDGLHHGINVYAYDGDLNIGDLRIWRARRRPLFDRREVDLLEAIKPHFTNALRNAQAMATARAEAGLWTDLWEKTPAAAFLFDQSGRLIHRNRAAQTIQAGLSRPNFDRLMERAEKMASGDMSSAEWGPFFLSVLKTENADTGQPIAAVQAYSRGPARLDADWLQVNLGLSPREAEICLLAAKGLTDVEMGSALGISHHTARTHLKHAFAKLDVTNRTELIHALLVDLVDFSF